MSQAVNHVQMKQMSAQNVMMISSSKNKKMSVFVTKEVKHQMKSISVQNVLLKGVNPVFLQTLTSVENAQHPLL